MNSYKDLYLYKILAAKVHKFIVKINPEAEMRRVYYKTYHRYPNLKEPKNLIEKIYWMQLHTDTSMWTKCADKYAMREYIRECGYEENLPKNYGHWYDVNEIDFEALPNEFVLKSNNGCGTVMIVKEKSKLDIKKTKRKLKQWLKVPYGWAGGQLHYTRIQPCIIAEELLYQDGEQNKISPSSLIDYKVWCINGEPENVLLVYGRNKSGYNLDLYDIYWERLDNKLNQNGHYFFNEKPVPKPSCLEQMLSMAKEISKIFAEVRVDFYVINGKPIIGELTFTTGYGYFTSEYYDYLGGKIDLSIVKKI